MDPDKLLADALKDARVYLKQVDAGEAENNDATAASVCAALLELDAWLRRGGFAPAAWKSQTETVCETGEPARDCPCVRSFLPAKEGDS